MRPFLSLEDKSLPANQLAASLVDLAASRGVNREKLLRGTGIFSEDIKRAERLSAQQLLKLITNAQNLVPGYDCAFQLGRRLFPGSYGQVSEALMHSRDMTDVLRILTLLRMQICPFISARFQLDGDYAYLLLSDSIGCNQQWQFIVECYTTALVSGLKLLLGQRVPLHFELPFSRPRYIQEYEENLGFRLNFNQPILAIKFERKWLSQPFPKHSRGLKFHAIGRAKQSQHVQQGFLDVVRQRLIAQPQTTLQQVASQFAISPATFKRKLKQHGVSFQSLHDEVRRQQAVYLLRLKGLNNEESASQMAFNDIPNFRRAVKRWTGQTPSQLKSV